jgi:hypothetical protein
MHQMRGHAFVIWIPFTSGYWRVATTRCTRNKTSHVISITVRPSYICSFISRTGWLELAKYFCLSSDLLPTCRRWGEESEPTQESAKSGGDGYSTSEDAESSINGTPLSVNASQSNAATPEHEEFASSESSNPSRNVGAELTCATKYAKCPFSFKSFVNTVTSRFFVKS